VPPAEAQDEGAEAPGRTGLRAVLRRRLTETTTWTFLILLGIVAGFAALRFEQFATVFNFRNIAADASGLLIIAVGMTFVIITAGIDLSVGSVLALAGAVMAMQADEHGVFVGILVGLLVGALLGVINGLFVTRARVAPFIATLAMLAIARGLTYLYTQGSPIRVSQSAFTVFGQGTLGAVPVPVILMVAVFLVSLLVLTQTRFGRYVFAIGSNAEVTRLAGIPIDRYVVAVYAISGLLAGLGGLILSGRLAAADPNAATGYELDVIAAVVIGGTSLFGGRGSAYSALLGIIVIQSISSGLSLLNLDSSIRFMVTGAVLLLAVTIDSLSRRSRVAHGRA
jgi:ribose transport system permease protein